MAHSWRTRSEAPKGRAARGSVSPRKATCRALRRLRHLQFLPPQRRYLRAIQKDSVVLKYSSRGTTYVPYRRQFRWRERLPCRTTRRDTARVALSAVCLCVPRNAGHVTEQPRRGIIFAKNAVAGAYYSCARARHTTPHHCLANGRHGEAIGAIRRGKSAIHFIAGPELGFMSLQRQLRQSR